MRGKAGDGDGIITGRLTECFMYENRSFVAHVMNIADLYSIFEQTVSQLHLLFHLFPHVSIQSPKSATSYHCAFALLSLALDP